MTNEQEWKWYWSRDQETYEGQCDSREQAITEGQENTDKGENFYIAEACREGLRSFIKGRVSKWIDDKNEENQDPEGDPISANITKLDWDDLQKRDLLKCLDVAAKEWAIANNIGRHVWAFDDIRNEELIVAPVDEVK